MEKAKRCTAVFLCFVLALLPCIPASGFAITATGTAVTLATVAAVLLASGVALTSADNAGYNTAITEIWNQMDSTIQDKFMDARYLASGAGAVVATYGSAAWNSIMNWVTTNFLADGSTSFTVPTTYPVFDLNHPVYYGPYPRVNDIISFRLGNSLCSVNITHPTAYRFTLYMRLANDAYFTGIASSTADTLQSLNVGSWVSNAPWSTSEVYYQCKEVGFPIRDVVYNDISYSLSYKNGNVRFGNYNITNNFTSLLHYVSTCLADGKLIGDFTALGGDVVLPSDGTPITCDPDSRYLPDASIDAVPSTLTDGQTIAVPLDVTLSGDNTISIPNDDVADTYRTKEVTDVAPYTEVLSNDVVVESFPESVIPDVSPDRPDVIPATPDETANKLQLPKLLLSKFPFCIPWDLYNAISIMNAPAEIPAFDYPFSFPELGIDETLHLDLNRFDTVATVVKWFLAAIWTVLLIYLTKKIVWK